MQQRRRIRNLALFMVALVVSAGGIVMLQAGPADSRMTGEVVDTSGKRVPGIVVKLIPRERKDHELETKANKKGRFVIPAIGAASGAYSPSIVSEDYVLVEVSASVRGSDGSLKGGFEEKEVRRNGPPSMQFMPASRVSVKLVVEPRAETAAESGGQLHGLQGAKGELEVLNSLFELGKWDDLLERSEKHLAKNPEDGGAIYLRAVALWRTDRLDEAQEHFERAAALIPDQPGLHGTIGALMIARGRAMQEHGDEAGSTAVFEQAAGQLAMQLEATPEDQAHLINYVIACESSGKTDDAIAALEKLLALDPEREDARTRLAELQLESGLVDEALANLDRLSGGGQKAANLIYNAAVELWNGNNLDAALAALNKAIELAPETAEFHRLRGRTLLQQGDNAAAIAALEEAIRLAPDDPSAQTDQQLIEALKKAS
ncbi:MAG: tetratricopeptide repeat protein [bacterium]|nr:tetratricopeptide repeat protein [bacterium]